jgi:hypothetical protein
VALLPLPVPGEGGGEGDLELRCPLVFEITLTPTLSRYRERGAEAAGGSSRTKRNKRSNQALPSIPRQIRDHHEWQESIARWVKM